MKIKGVVFKTLKIVLGSQQVDAKHLLLLFERPWGVLKKACFQHSRNRKVLMSP